MIHGSLLSDSVEVLALIALFLGMALVIPLVAGTVVSMLRIALGRTTLILPYQGDPGAGTVTSILAQELGEVGLIWSSLSLSKAQSEDACNTLSSQTLRETGRRRQPLAASPSGRLAANSDPTDRQSSILAERSQSGPAFTLTIAGIGLAVEMVILFFYRIRR